MTGQTISHYWILEKLGEGGMGVVYKAEDTKLRRTVALKFLPPHATENRERFLREAQAAASLNHPNICTIYEIDEEHGFIAMECIEGNSLKEKIEARPLPLPQAIDIAVQACTGLQAAHEKGVVHRDIKPANLMLTAQGKVKLMDFGLAQVGDRTRLTQTGSSLGTPAYMSPEQVRGEATDRRSDLWSLGVVLYEAVSGQTPFRGDTAAAVSYNILHTDAEPLTAVRSGLPPELDRIIAKALRKAPRDRYQHAEDLMVDLRHLCGQPVVATVTKRDWKVIGPAAGAVLALFAAGYFYFHRTPKLTDKDTIVLAEFINTTGDPVFDGTLRQGLAIQLGQSPFLSLVSDERIQKALALMGQQADVRLTPELAKEICERTASAAVLDGSIASLGSHYVVGLRARNCRTGDVLDEEQAQAARKEDVLNALSQIASKFRTRVGESLATVEKHSTPLAEATTSSLEALKAYSAAWKVFSLSGDAAALPLFKRAIEIDPKFAVAHAWLGRLYGNMGESVLAAESTSKAYRMRDRTSDAEKFSIAASYDIDVTGNLEKAQQTCELWAQTYPRDVNAHGILAGLIYPVFGKYEKAVEEARKVIALDPDFPVGYTLVAFNNTFLNRLEEAGNALQRASERQLEVPEFLVLRYGFAFLKGDNAGMEREVALGRGKSGAEDWMSDQEAHVLAYSGRLQQGRRMSRRAVDLAQQSAQRERSALWETGAAVREAFFGNAPAARRSAMAALELSKGRDVEYGAAFALARAGDSSGAQTLANDLEKRFREDTAVRFSYMPALRARLALNHGEPAQAIELLQIAAPYELGVPPSSTIAFFGSLYPIYLRGEAYLAAHQGAEAAMEFQKILDHRTIVISDPIGALAHLQLARALAMSGDKTRAKTAYQDFLTLWKDADPDIPILKQAKAEYAKLN